VYDGAEPNPGGPRVELRLADSTANEAWHWYPRNLRSGP
jgi:hypothetical protein